MKLLAIETSCDDTSIAVVERDNDTFLVNECIAYSQIQDHQQYGGVVPEIASRLHAEKITALLDTIGEDTIKSCDAIAVTTHPWLPWSLLVGKTAAHFLWSLFDKPIIEVNHIHGHIFSILLERSMQDFPFPRIILTASGGHNDIYLVEQNNSHCEECNDEAIQDIQKNSSACSLKSVIWNLSLKKLWSTLDDAAGECFDKVARMLWWPYPGGARIGEKASQGKPRDDIQFKRIWLAKDEHNFSFSGMKSQVHYLLQSREKQWKIQLKANSQELIANPQDISDIAYAFQEAMVEILAKKVIKAAIKHEAKTIGIVGWVSANNRLWEYANQYKNDKHPGAILTKPIKNLYSTDNAAMIAAAALVEKI